MYENKEEEEKEAEVEVEGEIKREKKRNAEEKWNYYNEAIWNLDLC